MASRLGISHPAIATRGDRSGNGDPATSRAGGSLVGDIAIFIIKLMPSFAGKRAFIQFAFLAFLLVYGLAASALIREHVHCGF